MSKRATWAIVKDLREWASSDLDYTYTHSSFKLVMEAAAELARLDAHVEMLRDEIIALRGED